MPKCYIYCRVSTERQAKQGDSLEVQEDSALREFHGKYEPQGFTLGGIYRDAASASRKQLLQRASGQKLGTELERGDLVIFPKMDRAFRSLRDMLNTRHIWKERGIHIRLMDFRDIDTSTPEGELMMNVIASVAQYEKDHNGQRGRDHWAWKRRLHKDDPSVVSAPGPARYGFKVVSRNGRKRYVPDLEIRKLAVNIIKWHDVDGLTWYEIWLHLTRHRIWHSDGKGGKKQWESTHAIERVYQKEKILQLMESQVEALANFMSAEQTSASPSP